MEWYRRYWAYGSQLSDIWRSVETDARYAAAQEDAWLRERMLDCVADARGYLKAVRECRALDDKLVHAVGFLGSVGEAVACSRTYWGRRRPKHVSEADAVAMAARLEDAADDLFALYHATHGEQSDWCLGAMASLIGVANTLKGY